MVSRNLNMPDINIKVGQDVTIELKANPPTGYEWFIGHKPDALLIESTRFVPDPTGVPGAPGTQVIRVMGYDECQDSFELIYMRPWDFDIAKKVTYAVIIDHE